MRRCQVASGFAAFLLIAPPTLAFSQSAPPAVARESGVSAPVDLSAAKPGRDPNQPVDSAYTAKIKEYTTESFFLSPLVDYLPASKTVPTPKPA